ncbi:unnamed protein product, partial [Didymodactylos carnosus]
MDDNDTNQWPEVLKFLFESANSNHNSLKESGLVIFESFPGIFGSQAEQSTTLIHQIFLSCLNNPDVKTVTHSLQNTDEDTALKALIDIAENSPKFLRPSINEIFELCLQ